MLVHKKRWFWIMMVLAGGFSYGILAGFIKLAYEAGLNELQISTAQLVLGTLLVWLYVWMRPKDWEQWRRLKWMQLAAVGFFGLALTTICINSSLLTLNASLSIILLFQFVWISIAMEAILKRTWPSVFQWIAVIIVMLGTVLALSLTAADFEDLSIRGVIFGLLSAITYSIFLVFTGRVNTNVDPVLKSAVMLTLAILPSILVMSLLFYGQSYSQGGTVSLLFWGLLAALLGMFIPTILFNMGIPKIGGSLAAMLGSIELPAAMLSALVLLREEITGIQWLGMLMIVVGIILSEMKIRMKKQHL